MGTSASYIRKLSGLLKKQGIMDSRKGVRGIHVPEIKDSVSPCHQLQRLPSKDLAGSGRQPFFDRFPAEIIIPEHKRVL